MKIGAAVSEWRGEQTQQKIFEITPTYGIFTRGSPLYFNKQQEKFMRKPLFASRFLAFQLAFLLIFIMPFQRVVPQQAKTFAPDTVFSNTSPITINTTEGSGLITTANSYPSAVNVSGMTGNITKVTVTIDGLTHSNINDLDILLVSPNGTKSIFLSDAQAQGVKDLVLTFDTNAASIFGANNPALSGTYQPTNFGAGDTFPAPAPTGPYLFGLSAFNGGSPNGAWTLYIVDDNPGSAGSFNRGWKLNVTTDSGAPQTFTNSSYNEISDTTIRATPYGSAINVSGLTGVISKVTVTLNNFSHQSTQDPQLLLVSPNGSSVVLMAGAGFSGQTVNSTITFDDAAALLPSNGPIPTGTYRPGVFFLSGPLSSYDTFPNPAPSQPYGSQLSVFNNFSPNGLWTLYVLDRFRGASGSIAGGWSLNITTTPYTLPTIGCAIPSLGQPTNFSVGSNPTGIASADFNNDSRPDLVTVNQFSNDVTVLLNNGTGGFPSATNLSVGSSPYAVAVGKFNADNNFDIVVANSASNNVSLLLGNGNGTFSAATNFAVGANPLSVAVGDFNNDNNQDLAVANFGGFFIGSVSILIGNGTGGFAAPTLLRARTQPAFVVTGNFNGDNAPDLAVANFGANSVTSYVGNGNGSFTEASTVTVGDGPVALATTSFNGDQFTDLAVANYNANSVWQLAGNGNGSFFSSNSQPSPNNPIAITTANILGSSNSTSLIVARSSTNKVRVDGTDFTVGDFPSGVVSADFNNDGLNDVASANAGSNNVSVLLNGCTVARGNTFDFDGDRRTDLAVFRPNQARWFTGSNVVQLGIPTDKIVAADYTGDGVAEFAVFRPESGLWFVPNVYYLQFGAAEDIPVPADFDGDRRADIAVFRPSTGDWFVRRSSDYGFVAVRFGANGDRPIQGDFDGDGKADFAVFRPSNGGWYWLNSSNGQFSGVQWGQNGDKAVAADYDGDGKTDIAVFRAGIWYIVQSSNGAFRSVTFGASDDIPVPGDYDSDGKFDVAVFRSSNGFWYVLRSSDNELSGGQYGANGDVPIPSSVVR
jgi:subtilisin-like proprotein convertase family protein